MREIKIRARYKAGTWFYGTSGRPKDMVHETNLELFWKEMRLGWLDEETVGEYTGLKDKNGREIYEGDILLIGFRNYDEREIDSVMWSDICGCWMLKESGEYVYEYGDIIEVIGNIYDNPELLLKDEERRNGAK